MLLSRHIWTRLISLLMGVCLFYLGWTRVDKEGAPFVDLEQTTFVVRPVNADTGWDGIVVKDPDSRAPLGVRFAPAAAKELTAGRTSWGNKSTNNASPGQLTTLRLDPPLAKFDPKTKDGTEISLSVLPNKEKVKRRQGFVRIEPGRYKFLATAEGHIPDSIEVELSAGEVKKLTVDLQKLPQPPTVSRPILVAPRPAPPPPPYRPAVRPPTRPRPQTAPKPQPRFTPVAPQPPAQPAPVFTPFP